MLILMPRLGWRYPLAVIFPEIGMITWATSLLCGGTLKTVAQLIKLVDKNINDSSRVVLCNKVIYYLWK